MVIFVGELAIADRGKLAGDIQNDRHAMRTGSSHGGKAVISLTVEDTGIGHMETRQP